MEGVNLDIKPDQMEGVNLDIKPDQMKGVNLDIKPDQMEGVNEKNSPYRQRKIPKWHPRIPSKSEDIGRQAGWEPDVYLLSM